MSPLFITAEGAMKIGQEYKEIKYLLGQPEFHAIHKAVTAELEYMDEESYIVTIICEICKTRQPVGQYQTSDIAKWKQIPIGICVNCVNMESGEPR